MEQAIFNWVLTGFSIALGWIMKTIWDAIHELKEDLKHIERDLPAVYVRKDDFRRAVTDIKEDVRELRQDLKGNFTHVNDTLGLIFEKLSKKEDRS